MTKWPEFIGLAGGAAGFAWGSLRWLARRPYLARIAHGHLPRVLAPQAVYVLREDGENWQASMRCPCGCWDIIELNLLTDERPCWHATIEANKTPTLKPSVWRQVGCRSHFAMRGGRIIWCQ